MDKQEQWYADNIPLRDQVIADVGANVGRLSQFFWDASGGTSRVVSIEPVIDNVLTIRERIKSANAERWTVEHCAASSKSGTVNMAVSRQNGGGWNSVVSGGKGVQKVRCRPLSALVPDATVVKVDIEGHEYDVLDEALPKLSNAHSWAVELHMVPGRPLQHALGAFMAHGYRVYAASADSNDADGKWMSQEVSATLDWSAVPVTSVRPDGSAFKMLHILALKHPAKT